MKSTWMYRFVLLSVFFYLSITGFTQPQNEITQEVIYLAASGYEIANSISFSSNGEELAVGTSSGILIFDAETHLEKQSLPVQTWVRSIEFSLDGQWLAAGLFDQTARIWDVGDLNPVWTFNGHTGWVRSIAFSPDAKVLATCADDDTIRIWNVEDGSLQLVIENMQGARVLAISPDGQILAVGLQDASIVLRYLFDGSLIRSLSGHTDWVRSLAFSPDGKILASGAFDATVRLWDVATGQLEQTFDDHQSSVLDLAFSPDGKILASGSVDTTVKLWDVRNGDLLHTLIGHTGFVYSLAFSPDGGMLASGADDNTLRIWNINTPALVNQQQMSTPSDCRACHHPIGQRAPAKVIQLRCDACHANGAGLNFCPIFPRDAQAVTEPLASASGNLVAGVPVGSDNLAVVLNYPTNGETLYTDGHYRSFLLVTGNVYYPGKAEDVLLELSAFSDSAEEPVLTLVSNPAESGQFTFRLMLNPTKTRPISIKLGGLGCADCHEDTRMEGGLPNGEIRLRVEAVAQDGIAWDERHIRIDASGIAQVEVKVIDDQSGEPVAGLPVRASTILYDWRARETSQVSDAKGTATLSLEALTQAFTIYELTVPQTTLDGYSYASVVPITLSLPAGAIDHEPVIISVSKEALQIHGELAGADAAERWTVWAIHLPDGTFRKSLVSPDGVFSFQGLASGEYLVVAEPESPATFTRSVEPVNMKIAQAGQSSIHPEAKDTAIFSCRVLDKQRQPIPFAWIKTASAQAAWSDPISGSFRLHGPERVGVPIEVWVPGYYSQVQVVDFTTAPIASKDFIFEVRPETDTLVWGAGYIVAPEETYYEMNERGLSFTKGWLWGEVTEVKPLEVSIANTQIEIQHGTFITEYLPKDGGWFHLADGIAVIRLLDGSERWMESDQIITVFDGGVGGPMPYDPVVLGALRAHREPLIEPIWQPELGARIRDSLSRFGIGLIQVITFITYLTVIVVLVGLLFAGLYWLLKRYRFQNHQNPGG